jgi:hypothetical protein
LISISTSHDPADGIQKIRCDMRGLRGFSGQDILNLPKPVAGFDQDTLEPGSVSKLDVGAHVPHDKGSPEIDLKGFARLLNETGLGLSAIALTGELRNRPRRVMGAEKYPVDDTLFLFDMGHHKVVNSLHKVHRVIAPGHSGLVRDHEDKKSVTVEHSYGLRHPGKDFEPGHMVDIAHLLIDGPIPIDEYSRFFHFTSDFQIVTRNKYKAMEAQSPEDRSRIEELVDRRLKALKL